MSTLSIPPVRVLKGDRCGHSCPCRSSHGVVSVACVLDPVTGEATTVCRGGLAIWRLRVLSPGPSEEELLSLLLKEDQDRWFSMYAPEIRS